MRALKDSDWHAVKELDAKLDTKEKEIESVKKEREIIQEQAKGKIKNRFSQHEKED